MASFTRSIDVAFKTLLFNKFADLLGIDKSGLQEENINKGVVQCPPEIALREVAEKRGQVFLEFINFWRMRTSPSWERQRTSVARRGFYVDEADESRSSTLHVKAMPIDLEYNVWFWSKNLDKIYECVEKYIFWQQDNPNLTLKYDNQYTLEFDLHFGEVVDESPIEEKYSKGTLFIYKFPIQVDAWVFEETSYKTIKKIELALYDKDDVVNYAEVLVNDSYYDDELAKALRMFRSDLYGIDSYDLVSNAIVIPGDFTEDFSAGEVIFVENSSSSDGSYTVESVSLEEGNTKLVVSESLVDSIVKGNIYKKEAVQ